MEQRTENNLVEVEEPKKSGRGQYERKERGIYQKHKLDRKITVKHYLNTKINLQKDSTQEPEYPVYVQITFNGKTTLIRSATKDVFGDEDDFEDFCHDDSNNRDFKREEEYIKYYFLEFYKNNVEVHFKASTPQQIIEIRNLVNISPVFKRYNYESGVINKIVDFALKDELFRIADELEEEERLQGEQLQLEAEDIDTHKSSLYDEFSYPVEYTICENNNISAMELLVFLERIKPEFSQIRKLYPSEIWNFNLYYGLLAHKSNVFNKLGATVVDVESGLFEKEFRKLYNNNEDVQKILVDLSKLSDNNYFSPL